MYQIPYTPVGNRCHSQVGNWGKFNEEAIYKSASKATGNQEQQLEHWKPSKLGEPLASSGLKFKERKVDQKSDSNCCGRGFPDRGCGQVEKLTSTYNKVLTHHRGIREISNLTLFPNPILPIHVNQPEARWQVSHGSSPSSSASQGTRQIEESQRVGLDGIMKVSSTVHPFCPLWTFSYPSVIQVK